MSIRIGTHDGKFHMDELLGVATLKLMHEKRGDAVEIVRTRDPKILATCQYLVDVGREYDHGRGRYDHHQRGGAGSRPDGGVEYASAGLVWKHFGCLLMVVDRQRIGSEEKEAAEMIDCNLMQHVDYRDNHGPQGRGQHVVELADALNYFLPCWNEEGNEDAAFIEALAVTEKILLRAIRRVWSELDARWEVVEAITTAKNPRIIVLDRGCPWQEFVVNNDPDARLVVIGNEKKGEWIVQCVPKAVGKNDDLRIRLPETWGGISAEDLQALTGVADAKFAHRDGFICGAASRQGAIALANLALKSA